MKWLKWLPLVVTLGCLPESTDGAMHTASFKKIQRSGAGNYDIELHEFVSPVRGVCLVAVYPTYGVSIDCP